MGGIDTGARLHGLKLKRDPFLNIDQSIVQITSFRKCQNSFKSKKNIHNFLKYAVSAGKEIQERNGSGKKVNGTATAVAVAAVISTYTYGPSFWTIRCRVKNCD